MDRLAINHLSPVSIPITSFPTPISTPKPIFPAAANSLHLRIPATGEKIVTDPLQKPSRLMAPDSSEETPAAIRLNPIEATAESFQEFGQVVEASLDGDEFGPGDAQLDLSRGVPRLYIMHLEDRPLKFSTITHHANVTQCLGSIGGHVWYLGVAKPSIVDPSEIKGVIGPEIIRSHCGHYYVPPAVDEVRVFKISGEGLTERRTNMALAPPHNFLFEVLQFRILIFFLRYCPQLTISGSTLFQVRSF